MRYSLRYRLRSPQIFYATLKFVPSEPDIFAGPTAYAWAIAQAKNFLSKIFLHQSYRPQCSTVCSVASVCPPPRRARFASKSQLSLLPEALSALCVVAAQANFCVSQQLFSRDVLWSNQKAPIYRLAILPSGQYTRGGIGVCLEWSDSKHGGSLPSSCASYH